MDKKRVGFIFADELRFWNGGINYYKNLISILNDSESYEPVIICSSVLKEVCERKFPKTEIVCVNILKEGTLLTYLRKFILYLFKYNLFIDSILKKNRIDLVSHVQYFPLNKNSKTPSCCWIPDFQSKHYPALFTKKDLKREIKLHNILLKNSDRIIVSSNDCKNDLLHNYTVPEGKKIEVFQFALPPQKSDEIFSENELEKYGLKSKSYYLITNQFWEHKNHLIVLKALQKSIELGEEIDFKIVSTGLIQDLRNPEYGEKLLSIIRDYNLGKYFITTGNISYHDVKLLQYYSLAIIQPSLFEGWNTAVEECKMIGKKIILSNIPVHIEQNPDNVIFFNPNDENELKNILMNVKNDYDENLEINYLKSAESKQEVNWNNFADHYKNILNEMYQGV